MPVDRSIDGIAVRSSSSSSSPVPSPPPTPPAPTPPADLLASFGPLVTMVRWAMLAVSLALAALDDEPTVLLAFGLPLVAYAALRTVRPLRYLTRRIESLVQVLAEVLLTLAVIVATGFWASPYVFTLATAILAAGLARGFGFALRTAAAAVVAVALPYHLEESDARLLDTVQWATELLLVGVIAGYARRLFGEAEEQTVLARQANELLAQLHDIAQTLPTSLDLDETAAEALAAARAIVEVDAAAILLADPTGGAWTVAAAAGVRVGAMIDDAHLPTAARIAVRDGRPIRDDVGPFLSREAHVALYVPLVARGRAVGVIALEAANAQSISDHHVEAATTIAHRAALAVDNARWFTLLRRVGADEERTRIARDLHDRVGQSLAFVGFELDRISKAAAGHGGVEADLLQLREDVRTVVAEVRDTLYDLRTDVTERDGLVATLGAYVDRVSSRTGVRVTFEHEESARLPLRQERELWRIAQEAVTNATRHGHPATVVVRWYCDDRRAILEVADDGRGMPKDQPVRADAYGVRGMRERAAAIGAQLTITSPDGGGTTVRCEMPR